MHDIDAAMTIQDLKESQSVIVTWMDACKVMIFSISRF